MLWNGWILIVIAFLCGWGVEDSSAKSSLIRNRNVALIYSGPGSCRDQGTDCTRDSAVVAKMAGLIPRVVQHDAIDENSKPSALVSLFSKARVWIQPGGVSNEAFDAMDTRLIEGIRQFVKNGGGYVGFCAGGFMATERISRSGEGLGIISGMTRTYHRGWSMAPVRWLGQDRVIWFEGGPYFYGFDEDVEVTATYETGAAAAIRSQHGKGRVWVTGLHPEAPPHWSTDDGIIDPDGSEQHLAAQMVRWAAQLPEQSILEKSRAVKKAAIRTR